MPNFMASFTQQTFVLEFNSFVLEFNSALFCQFWRPLRFPATGSRKAGLLCLGNASLFTKILFTILAPLDTPPPNQQSDGFPLEFRFKRPKTELRTLSQNCVQTLPTLRAKTMMNKRAFLNAINSFGNPLKVFGRIKTSGRKAPFDFQTSRRVSPCSTKSANMPKMTDLGGGIQRDKLHGTNGSAKLCGFLRRSALSAKSCASEIV